MKRLLSAVLARQGWERGVRRCAQVWCISTMASVRHTHRTDMPLVHSLPPARLFTASASPSSAGAAATASIAPTLTATASAPPSPPSAASSPSSSSSSRLFSASGAPVPRHSTLDSILRVDHAGEYGAQCIYEGQLAALRLRAAVTAPGSPFSAVAAAVRSVGGLSAASSGSGSGSHAHTERSISVIAEMRDQEVEHLEALSALVPRHRCRPTALLPLWHLAGYALGYGTALMGTRAAMACTVAVETVITEHYNDQLRTLSGDEWRQPGERWDEASSKELSELRALIKKNRDDEEHHKDVGIEHEAEQTPLYSLLTNVIKTGCEAAIAVAKKA